jgi:hypothetical protein
LQSSREAALSGTKVPVQNERQIFETPDELPCRAITQGMSRVRDARQTVLLAVGTSKAAAIALGLSEMLDAIKPRFSAGLTLMVSELHATGIIVDGRGFIKARS